MLIHAYARKKPHTVELFGKRYTFKANDDGAFVCEVKEPDAIERLLEITEGYRVLKAADEGDDDGPDAAFVITSGDDETLNLLTLNKQQLLEFCKDNDISVHPNARETTIRQRIVEYFRTAEG